VKFFYTVVKQMRDLLAPPPMKCQKIYDFPN